jgi:CheY-like chemotaxis protein
MLLRCSRIWCTTARQPTYKRTVRAWDEGSPERLAPLMTINNIHVLTGGHPAAQLVLADRSQADSTIAVRAIGRLYPDLEVRPVTNLAGAKRVLIGTRRVIALVASGLDGKTCLETIRWFARLEHGTVVAMLEDWDERHRQEALEAGASHVCSKPEFLVAQLRHELAARLEGARPEPYRCWG